MFCCFLSRAATSREPQDAKEIKPQEQFVNLVYTIYNSNKVYCTKNSSTSLHMTAMISLNCSTQYLYLLLQLLLDLSENRGITRKLRIFQEWYPVLCSYSS